jgi:hypothetical protein
MSTLSSATIKLFLPFGDPKRLRTAEISNWNGKAIAAPRTELDLLLVREELSKSGVYILIGTNPNTDRPMAYIGEGEIVKERLKKHKGRDFWVQAFVFISQDENLTKAHIRYLEGRVIEDAKAIGRFELINYQLSGSRLPESDRADMDVFLGKIYQLLPVLGSDIVTPILKPTDEESQEEEELTCEIKGLVAKGRRTPNGFVVFKGSQAVLEDRPSAARQAPYVVVLRQQLVSDRILVPENDHLLFAKDTEFSSPSSAAAVIYGGSAPGPIAWKNREGKTLKQLESE